MGPSAVAAVVASSLGVSVTTVIVVVKYFSYIVDNVGEMYIMKNNNATNQDKERKKSKLVVSIIMACLIIFTTIWVIVCGVYSGNASIIPTLLLPLVITSICSAFLMVISVKKKRN